VQPVELLEPGHGLSVQLKSTVNSSQSTVRIGCALLALALLADCRSAEVREVEGAFAEPTPSGVVHEVQLTAAPTELPLLDGQLLKVWAYDGQVPGPTLRVRLGDTLRVTLANRLPEPTTIHWHGVRLPNAMDGVPGVTQPAIEPGQRFTYEFMPKDAGTYWFHPHLSASEQVERGLYGVVIVEERDPPPYSRDVVWVLDDWLIAPDGQIAPEFNTRHDLMHDGRWGNVVTVNGDKATRLPVRPGERIRLRLLDVANGRVFRPELPGLAAQVIAVDGPYVERPIELQAHPYELAPGNRLDLDITIPTDARGRTFEVMDHFLDPPRRIAEIVVDGDAVPTPLFASPAHAHVPAWRAAQARPLTGEVRLNARTGGPFGITWTMNDQAFDHAAHAGHGGHLPPLLTLPRGGFARVRFVNDSFRLHPMHLHGTFFKVLSRNGQPVDEGHFRDTVLVHAKEAVEIGLVPTELGRWMMHCHILEHAESGMMALVEVR
jgi:FtsP/CotA-like multicopper oxidase with cupredoxin domain